MTPLRRLHGITYWVITNPRAIYDFINTNLRKEWEEDARFVGPDPQSDPWLLSLNKRRWRLETLDLDRIKLNPDIVNYVDPRRGYSFAESLAMRRAELCRVIELYGSVIWPVVVKGETLELADGYCRLSALKELKVSQTFAYTGSL